MSSQEKNPFKCIMNKETQPSRQTAAGEGSICCALEKEKEKEKENVVCFLLVPYFDGGLQ